LLLKLIPVLATKIEVTDRLGLSVSVYLIGAQV